MAVFLFVGSLAPALFLRDSAKTRELYALSPERKCIRVGHFETQSRGQGWSSKSFGLNASRQESKDCLGGESRFRQQTFVCVSGPSTVVIAECTSGSAARGKIIARPTGAEPLLSLAPLARGCFALRCGRAPRRVLFREAARTIPPFEEGGDQELTFRYDPEGR